MLFRSVVEPAAKVIEQTPKAEPVVEKVVERKETPQPQKETPKPVVVEEKKPESTPQPAPCLLYTSGSICICRPDYYFCYVEGTVQIDESKGGSIEC